MTTTSTTPRSQFGTILPGENVPEPGPYPISEKPTVVAVHASGRLGFADFQNCWLKVAYDLHIPLIHSVGLHWEQHLSMGLEKAVSLKSDYILTLDWDSIFDVDDVKKLIDFMQANPSVGAAWPQQMTRHMTHQETPLCNDPFADYEQEFTKQAHGHFGLTIFRRQVFDTLSQPWLHPYCGAGGWSDPTTVHADIYFWRKLADRRVITGQLNTVQIGHIEACVIWGDGDRRFIQLPQEYREHGRPANAKWTGKDGRPLPDLKLNLGSGRQPKEGYISIDGLFGDAVYPLAMPDNSADDIYASHVLEHFSHRHTENVLREWVRVLKPGGRIRIAVPDFRACASEYLRGDRIFDLNGMVMGGHMRQDDVHGAIFDRVSLSILMQRCGLVNIDRFEAETPNGKKDCASYWCSLNLQGVKEPAAAPITAVDLTKDGDTVEQPVEVEAACAAGG